MLYAAVCTAAVIVPIYSLLVENWILYVASCCLAALAIY